MSVLSANTLFHFTNKDALISILATGFKFFYNVEFGDSMGGVFSETLIPMISLCDLPMSKLSKHINGYNWDYNGTSYPSKKYGTFGIGMTKTWGHDNKFSPVTYSFADNVGGSAFLELLAKTQSELNVIINYLRAELELGVDKETIQKIDAFPYTLGFPAPILYQKWFGAYESRATLINAIGYVKPYLDSRTGQIYYDEREWRLVPHNTIGELPPEREVPILYKTENGYSPIVKHRLGAEFSLDHYKSVLFNNYQVLFKAADIKYIIVESDDDIKHIVDRLQEINQKATFPINYSQEDIEKLTSRIITCKQIQEDF